MALVSRRRIFMIISTLTALALLSVFVYQASGPWTDLSTARAKLVLANAFAVSRPDYRIRADPSKEADIGPWGGTVPLLVDPRSAYPLNKGDEATRQAAVELLPSGDVSAPHLRPWYLTSVISSSGESAPIGLTPKDQGLVDLPDKNKYLRALVMVELSASTSAKIVDAWLLNGIDVAIFRLQNDSKGSVSWDDSFCDDKSLPCASDHPMPASDGFKLWVSTLRDEDAPLLAQLNLDLGELRRLSRAGTVEGFIASVELEEIKSLSQNRQVESVEIISVSLGDGRD
ncbi:hypothetical protein ACQEUU_11930 [Nonomuraea sp. CA-218870]|uniref:hypothetical protein n=1 Tax=Nonomuraea sp. CA-218870 TaxID=3239998 RepID=UPI003D909F43